MLVGALAIGLGVLPDDRPDPVGTARQAGAQTSSSPAPALTGAEQSSPARRERREAGSALARNAAVELSGSSRRALRQGLVDLRLVALLVQLSADHPVRVVEFDSPSTDGTAWTGVRIGAVDGRPIGSPASEELADAAREQLGVFRPAEVRVAGGTLLIRYDASGPSDAASLAPVPFS